MNTVTKSTLEILLANITSEYTKYLSSESSNEDVLSKINGLIDGCAEAEINKGNYYGRIQSVMPSRTNSFIILSLQYQSKESSIQHYSVMLCLIPSPNGRGYIALTSSVKVLTNTDVLLPGNTPAKGICIYDPKSIVSDVCPPSEHITTDIPSTSNSIKEEENKEVVVKEDKTKEELKDDKGKTKPTSTFPPWVIY